VANGPQALEVARTFASGHALAGSASVQIVATMEEARALLRIGKTPRFEPVPS
jgi:hypothetical protein